MGAVSTTSDFVTIGTGTPCAFGVVHTLYIDGGIGGRAVKLGKMTVWCLPKVTGRKRRQNTIRLTLTSNERRRACRQSTTPNGPSIA